MKALSNCGFKALFKAPSTVFLIRKYRILTHSQLRQGAAQLFCNVVQLFQLGLLLPSILTYYFLL